MIEEARGRFCCFRSGSSLKTAIMAQGQIEVNMFFHVFRYIVFLLYPFFWQKSNTYSFSEDVNK
jgi:hypothetical protein